MSRAENEIMVGRFLLWSWACACVDRGRVNLQASMKLALLKTQNLSHPTITTMAAATMSSGSGMDKYYSSKIGELNSVSSVVGGAAGSFFLSGAVVLCVSNELMHLIFVLSFDHFFFTNHSIQHNLCTFTNNTLTIMRYPIQK